MAQRHLAHNESNIRAERSSRMIPSDGDLRLNSAISSAAVGQPQVLAAGDAEWHLFESPARARETCAQENRVEAGHHLPLLRKNL